MLSFEKRLRKNREIEKVFKKGKKLQGRYLKIYFLENNLKNNRYNIIISKKVSKKAFLRNKLKRIIKKEIILFNFSDSPKKDIIVLVSPTTLNNQEDVKKDIGLLLAKI